jgi:hypothetical protein
MPPTATTGTAGQQVLPWGGRPEPPLPLQWQQLAERFSEVGARTWARASGSLAPSVAGEHHRFAAALRAVDLFRQVLACLAHRELAHRGRKAYGFTLRLKHYGLGSLLS